jgi:hypothetical protein
MLIHRNDFEHYIKNFQFKKLFNELGWEHVRKEHREQFPKVAKIKLA